MGKSRSLKSALTGYQSVVALREYKARVAQAKDAKARSVTGEGAKDKKARKRERQREALRSGQEEIDRLVNEQLEEDRAADSANAPPKKIKGKAKLQTYPFDRDDTILLIGEANFSFALSLLSAPHSHPPHLILATSYDSEETCFTKYPDAESHVAAIRAAGARVEFDVDARYLDRYPSITGSQRKGTNGERWSKIVFNFPHVGAGIKDQDRNILTNQELMMGFFRSASGQLTDGPTWMERKGTGKKKKKTKVDDGDDEDEEQVDQIKEVDDDMQSEDYETEPAPTAPTHRFVSPTKQGSILVTLRNSPPYTLWDVPRLATRPPKLLNVTPPRYRICRSFAFDPALYPGYEHRRTLGFKEGLSKSGNEEIMRGKEGCRTWEFALKVDGE